MQSLNLHGTTVPSGSHLSAVGISKAFPDRRVLTDVNISVASNERICLVGENGSGKTTLLRIIAGLDDDYIGDLRIPGTVGLYHQVPPFPVDWTVHEIMTDATRAQLDAREEVIRTANEIAVLPDDRQASAAYDHALEEAERTGAWDVEATVDRVLDGLGLAGIEPGRRGTQMSGGQLSRLSLAWLLLSKPTTLLLDEPTNDLDDRGTQLLTEMIRLWRGPVLSASHDRAFLDDIATAIIDLDPAPTRLANTPDDNSPGSGFDVTSYTGTYSDYLASKSKERQRWEKRYRDEQDEVQRLRALVGDSYTVGHTAWKPRTEVRMAQKYYADRNAAAVSRRVRDAERKLEQLEQNQVRRPPQELTFRLNNVAHAGVTDSAGTVLVGTGLAVPGRLDPVDIALRPHEKILITGQNSSGKSTLLAILARELTDHEGKVKYSQSLTIDTLNQSVGILLENRLGPRWRDNRVEDAYASAVGRVIAEQVPLASHGLIAGRDRRRLIGRLSTGQQRRLELAIILADPPTLLLLDEPTNHVSPRLATALEQAIAQYSGAVIVASHDRWLRRRWAGALLHLEGAHVLDSG